MKVAVALAFLAAVANAGSFSAEDQAIWLDRHNYFRTTGLPWAAGDMRRIGWSSDLATSAASTAAQCSAASAAGVNVFQSSTANSSSIIDEAVQQWVVETSMTTLKTLPQPGAVGVPVGTGVYNAYSQVLWASTTSVGCATASCSGGDLVVCEYAPAGNDASSPWYVHAETASACPSGTTASQGLCVVEGDAANDQIAAIPAGKLTYEVYAGYVANMQTLLIEAARAIASGSTNQTAAPTDSATQTAPAATTAAPMATTAAPTTSYSQASSSSTSADSSATKTGATKTTTGSAYSSLESGSGSGSGSEASTATKNGKTASSSTTDSSSSSSDASKTTKTGKTASSSTTDSSSETSMATKSGKTTTSSSTTDASDATTQTSQTSQSSSTSSSDESAPGTVKASSDTGSTFTNQTPSTTTESSTEQSSTTPSAEQTSGSATTAPSTASAESASTITNKSSTSSGGGISAAGMAGMIVLAVVGVAAFGVVMSYKRNQQRQREIMRDGGIRII